LFTINIEKWNLYQRLKHNESVLSEPLSPIVRSCWPPSLSFWVMRKQKPGSSETTSVRQTVSRVMKSKLTVLECTMDTLIGHPKSPGIPSTHKHFEEASRSGRDLAKDVTERCIKSTICWSTRASSKTKSLSK
jgi:hypothetical protein